MSWAWAKNKAGRPFQQDDCLVILKILTDLRKYFKKGSVAYFVKIRAAFFRREEYFVFDENTTT